LEVDSSELRPALDVVTLAAEAIGGDVPADAAPVVDLMALGACVPASDVIDEDGDFSRNAGLLTGLCIEEEEFRERRRPWTIQTVSSARPGPLWAVMHDDEDVAFDNALQAVKAYGGVMIALETGGKRNQDGVDPNRNFSADGIGCSKLGNSATPEFTAFFSERFQADQPIFVLHNNPDGPIPTGGVGHVTMTSMPRDMEAVESTLSGSPLADDHTLVLIAGTEPIADDLEAKADQLAAKGINVILEPVREGRGDCSFSNYAVLSGHQTYYNITVDHGGGDKQRQIINIIMGGFGEAAASL
jgi:hypothetical protein